MTGFKSNIKVRKNTGELVPFDVEKLKNALRRSGAKEKEIPRVIEKVRSSLYDGITTRKIYQIAYGILSRISHHVAGRYRLKKALFQLGPSGYPFEHFVAKLLEFEPLLITNTRFTEDALQFARCKKMKLISWDYPGGNALKDRIDRSGFHPITSLKSLTKVEKKGLLEKGIVLCREVVGNPDILTQFAIPQQRQKKILKEAQALI